MADTDPPSPALMRRDMQSMLTFIQGARIVSMAREVEIGRFQGWLVERFFVGLVLAGLGLAAINLPLLGWWDRRLAALLSALVVITLCSRTGAIVSIGRRMRGENLGVGTSGDSIYTLAAMDSGRNGLVLALVSSNVFGLVTFALFASGVPAVLGLRGGIVPSFSAVEENWSRNQAAEATRRAFELRDQAGRCNAVAAPATEPTGTLTTTSPPATAGTPSPPKSGSASCAELRATADAATREAATMEKLATDAGIARLQSSLAGNGWLESLRAALGLASVPDLFKLLLWAFIAGFFEQFVPDMLDRIAARSKEAAQRDTASN